MKTRLVAGLLLIATSIAVHQARAFDDDAVLQPMRAPEFRPRPGVQSSPSDSVWIGYTPGYFNASNNWWSIHSGSGAAGYGRPINGEPGKGIWNWDEPVHGDSLQGWWPFRLTYTTALPSETDRNRPHTCLDFGNAANYVLNAARGQNWQTRTGGTESGWRTFGVDGVWHVDGGSTVTAAGLPAPTWSPLEGTRSAWMGLRAHGDLTHVDPLTGNAFNEDVLMFPTLVSGMFGGRHFPGYAGRQDQMLYRDIDLGGVDDTSLTISFRYRTNLSTGKFTTNRYGWFHHDPLSPTAGATNPQPNNFISGMDAGSAGAPVDSFMVYIGSGVDGETWRGSDGGQHDLYDLRHRWFAEVLHSEWDPTTPPANPRPLYYRQLLSVAGNAAPSVASFTIPSGILQQFISKSPRIRLVFRVKTNNRVDDDDNTGGYTSGGAGAAIVDDVQVRIGADPFTLLGDFESSDAIDNDPAVSAEEAWKSTGKAPAISFHREPLEQVTFEDICGQKGEIGRACNMSAGVLSSGDHDRDEEVGTQVVGDPERDGMFAVMSPVISFHDDDGNPATPNPIGLYGAGGNGGVGDIVATGDYMLRFDVHYSGEMDGGDRALYLNIQVQSYPTIVTGATPPYPTWGALRGGPFFPGFFEQKAPLCRPEVFPLRLLNTISTSNPNGIPDSIRVGVRIVKVDHGFALDAGAPYTDAPTIDNLSLGVVDAPVAPLIGVSWFQDAFPANEDTLYPGNPSLFDTTTALIATGNNISLNDTYSISGDSVVVYSNQARVDLIFRVLPGPGNYEPIGDGQNGMLRRLPTSAATITPGDGSWWDVLRQSPGEFASTGAASQLQSAPTGWDPNVWISVRCDSAETNIWPNTIRGSGPYAGRWQTTIHESDPRFEALGIVHNRCFMRTTSGPFDNVECDGTPPAYLPMGTPGTTKEGTKIIPDGLLTPGSHVQYFFRSQSQEAPGSASGMLPDTTVVVPQEQDLDGHRWQHFSILPDRWKDSQYFHPVLRSYGPGPACLLVVDGADGDGDERAWLGAANYMLATYPEKRGAHNGWDAGPGVDPNDAAARVAAHGGSPGTSWDLYQVKDHEGTGTIGSRLAYRGGSPLEAAKSARNAPTPKMLEAYYSLMLMLTGDIDYELLGPTPQRTSDDVGILEDWLASGSTEEPTRGLWIMGSGFVTSLLVYGSLEQFDFASDYLHVDLESQSYRGLTSVQDPVIDLRVLPGWQDKNEDTRYGLRNLCLSSDLDVLLADGSPAEIASYYEPPGSSGSGKAAGIFKPWLPNSPWMSLVNGFSIQDLEEFPGPGTAGRGAYFYKVFANVWSRICSISGPVEPNDVPHVGGDAWVSFVRLLDNPSVRGRARVQFGLAKADRVEAKIYDVTGRLVRVLADRAFPAGEHELVWDGLDGNGSRVARGVYFTRFRYRESGFVSQRKLTMLE